MLDMRSGRVSYAVLSFGGFIGIGEKLFASWEKDIHAWYGTKPYCAERRV